MNEKLIVSVEDIKNELNLDVGDDLGMQPQQVQRWIARQQSRILNYIAYCAKVGIEQVNSMLNDPHNVKVVREAILEHIDFLADNNYVQADNLLKLNGQTAEPSIAPLAHLILLNAGLLNTGE
ncbi:MAG: hypothetical protein K2M64_04120 [Clostridia bacterium]|nr:hypothetical protein [Clostridia bacterium]